MHPTTSSSILAIFALFCCILTACGPEYQEEDGPGDTSTTSTTTTTDPDCANLDEDACADATGCTPEYEVAPCPGDGSPCAEVQTFVGCVEDDQDACSGLSEDECHQDPACQPIYGSPCDNLEGEDRDCAAVAIYDGCEEAPRRECYSDNDCGPNQACYFDGAGYDPEAPDCACAPCPPGEECEPCDCGGGGIPAPAGYCGPAHVEPECYSDRDCDDDEYCNYDLTQPAPAPDEDCFCNCPDDDPNCGCDCGGAAIPQGGVCTPRNDPQDFCTSDADCDDNEYCAWGDQDWGEDCACPPCAPGEECPPCDCGDGARPAPEGICQPRSYECYDDSDCQDGYVCAWLGDDEPDADPCVCPDDDPDCGCGGTGMPEPWPGECIPSGPQNECDSDSDCPGGYCAWTDTCDGPGCPPSESYCVYPNCDDNSQVVCDMIPPTCEEGTVAAIRGGCYDCVDPRTCEEQPDECWGAWIDENGTCRAPNDGIYPDHCCHDIEPPEGHIETSGHAQNTCAPNDGAGMHIELHPPEWIEGNQACSDFGQGERLDLFIYDWEVLQNGGTVEVGPDNWMSGYANACDADGNCFQPSSGGIYFNPINTDDRTPYVHGRFFLIFDDLGVSIEGEYDVDLCMNDITCG